MGLCTSSLPKELCHVTDSASKDSEQGRDEEDAGKRREAEIENIINQFGRRGSFRAPPVDEILKQYPTLFHEYKANKAELLKTKKEAKVYRAVLEEMKTEKESLEDELHDVQEEHRRYRENAERDIIEMEAKLNRLADTVSVYKMDSAHPEAQDLSQQLDDALHRNECLRDELCAAAQRMEQMDGQMQSLRTANGELEERIKAMSMYSPQGMAGVDGMSAIDRNAVDRILGDHHDRPPPVFKLEMSSRRSTFNFDTNRSPDSVRTNQSPLSLSNVLSPMFTAKPPTEMETVSVLTPMAIAMTTSGSPSSVQMDATLPPPLTPAISVSTCTELSVAADLVAEGERPRDLGNVIGTELNLKKVYKWKAGEARWERVCKAATIKVFVNGEQRRMVRIQSREVTVDEREEIKIHFEHSFPDKKEGHFRSYDQRRCCSWLIAEDMIGDETKLSVSVVFRTDAEHRAFAALFDDQ